LSPDKGSLKTIAPGRVSVARRFPSGALVFTRGSARPATGTGDDATVFRSPVIVEPTFGLLRET